jgi:hypothetical protein
MRWSAGAIAVLFVANISASSAQTFSDYSGRFVKSSNEECLRKQRMAEENKGISNSQIEQYCSCVMKRMVDVLTMSELQAIEKTGINPQSVQTKMNVAGASCVSEGNMDADLILRGKKGCLEKNASAIPTFKEVKIDRYCGCLHQQIVGSLTKDQKLQLILADKPMPWLQEAVNSADTSCRRIVLGQ